MQLHLYIGNKNYSSWSFRAWLGLKHLGLNFEEHIIPLRMANTKDSALHVSPSGTVPCLHHGDLVIWDSLAILEYANEIATDKKLLPHQPAQRALSRSACAQMHSDFIDLRQECPMNIRRRKPKDISVNALKDLQRVYTLWSYLQERKNSSAPFLLGEFSMVDAYFAPVVSRIISYDLDQENHRSYIELISTLDTYEEWENGAYQESWIIEGDE